jgi:hypothetical protein
MKKLSVIILAFLISGLSVVAQTDTSQIQSNQQGDIKTLFGGVKNLKVGYYIGPEGIYTQFDGKDVFMAGLGMGVIFNHWLSIGLAGAGVVNSGYLYYPAVRDTTGAYLYGGYGGVRAEFKIFPKYPIHVSFPLLIGIGGLSYNTATHHQGNHYYDGSYEDGNSLDWSVFFVVEPGVMAEVNIVKFMRIGAGVSYRYTPNLELMNTPGDLFNNFSFNFCLKFGKF